MSEIQEQEKQTLELPLSFWEKFLYGALVVAAPIFNFIFIDVLEPDWQTGKTSDYINLFLSPKASILFFPLLAYAIISYIMLLSDSDRYGKSFPIRFGVYTGVWLALQYSVLTLLATGESPLTILLVILAFATPWILTRIYRWLASKWNPSLVSNVSLALGVIVFLTGAIAWKNPLAPLFFLAILAGVAAPFWSFLIAGQASLWLLRNYESKFTILRGLGTLAWLSAYVYALRFNILKMYELYAALPPQPPDCYIATAAAKGHPRFVGSQEVILSNGKSMRVNRQLQRLKAAEIAWMGVSASSHRMMRRIYDVLGQWLAKRIQHPFLADAAYLLLIPAEWLFTASVKWIFPELDEFASKIYSGRNP